MSKEGRFSEALGKVLKGEEITRLEVRLLIERAVIQYRYSLFLEEQYAGLRAAKIPAAADFLLSECGFPETDPQAMDFRPTDTRPVLRRKARAYYRKETTPAERTKRQAYWRSL